MLSVSRCAAAAGGSGETFSGPVPTAVSAPAASDSSGGGAPERMAFLVECDATPDLHVEVDIDETRRASVQALTDAVVAAWRTAAKAELGQEVRGAGIYELRGFDSMREEFALRNVEDLLECSRLQLRLAPAEAAAASSSTGASGKSATARDGDHPGLPLRPEVGQQHMLEYAASLGEGRIFSLLLPAIPGDVPVQFEGATAAEETETVEQLSARITRAFCAAASLSALPECEVHVYDDDFQCYGFVGDVETLQQARRIRLMPAAPPTPVATATGEPGTTGTLAMTPLGADQDAAIVTGGPRLGLRQPPEAGPRLVSHHQRPRHNRSPEEEVVATLQPRQRHLAVVDSRRAAGRSERERGHHRHRSHYRSRSCSRSRSRERVKRRRSSSPGRDTRRARAAPPLTDYESELSQHTGEVEDDRADPEAALRRIANSLPHHSRLGVVAVIDGANHVLDVLSSNLYRFHRRDVLDGVRLRAGDAVSFILDEQNDANYCAELMYISRAAPAILRARATSELTVRSANPDGSLNAIDPETGFAATIDASLFKVAHPNIRFHNLRVGDTVSAILWNDRRRGVGKDPLLLVATKMMAPPRSKPVGDVGRGQRGRLHALGSSVDDTIHGRRVTESAPRGNPYSQYDDEDDEMHTLDKNGFPFPVGLCTFGVAPEALIGTNPDELDDYDAIVELALLESENKMPVSGVVPRPPPSQAAFAKRAAVAATSRGPSLPQPSTATTVAAHARSLGSATSSRDVSARDAEAGPSTQASQRVPPLRYGGFVFNVSTLAATRVVRVMDTHGQDYVANEYSTRCADFDALGVGDCVNFDPPPKELGINMLSRLEKGPLGGEGSGGGGVRSVVQAPILLTDGGLIERLNGAARSGSVRCSVSGNSYSFTADETVTSFADLAVGDYVRFRAVSLPDGALAARLLYRAPA